MNNSRIKALMLCGACVLLLASCKESAKDADWYLAHSDALQAKLTECKADAEAAKVDEDCKAATDAFLRWYAASGLAARQADAEGSSLDSRLSAPPAAPEEPSASPASATDPAAAPAAPDTDKPQDQPTATPPSN